MINYSGKRILIIDGGSRQSLPIIKGFRDLGCVVSVYCSSRLDVGYVYKYTDQKVLGVIDYNDETTTYISMKKIISSNSYDLIVPTSDFFATLLSRHKTELSKHAIIYVNEWSVYSKAIDKLQTMKLCMDNDIPSPKTMILEEDSEIPDLGWTYPLVVKPRIGFGARGFSVVNSKRDLIKRVELTEKTFGPTLVQEYIPQTDKQYQVELVIDSNGVCKAFVLMDKVRWYPVNGGSSTMNVTIHDAKVKSDCLRLMEEMDWRGYASLDLIRDPRDGVIKIMEVNPRLNGTAKICFASGVDLSLLILQDAFGQIVSDQNEYKTGVGLRYFHMDVLWFIKSPNRFQTKPSWFNMKNTVDQIFEWSDLKPGFVYTIVAFKKLLNDKKNRTI